MGIQKKTKEEATKKNEVKKKEPMTEKEAARIIQFYWKKWKKNSLFQQLLFCRAEKQQQLMYFCQQVSIFILSFTNLIDCQSYQLFPINSD